MKATRPKKNKLTLNIKARMKKALMTSLNPENKSLYVRRIYNNKKRMLKLKDTTGTDVLNKTRIEVVFTNC